MKARSISLATKHSLPLCFERRRSHDAWVSWFGSSGRQRRLIASVDALRMAEATRADAAAIDVEDYVIRAGLIAGNAADSVEMV